MNSKDFLKNLSTAPLVAVLRAPSADQAQAAIHACVNAGIKNIEVTFSTPNTCDVIRKSKERYKDCKIGAGTILNVSQMDEAHLSGADFLVSPHTQDDLLQHASNLQYSRSIDLISSQQIVKNNNVTYIAGASTPSASRWRC